GPGARRTAAPRGEVTHECEARRPAGRAGAGVRRLRPGRRGRPARPGARAGAGPGAGPAAVPVPPRPAGEPPPVRPRQWPRLGGRPGRVARGGQARRQALRVTGGPGARGRRSIVAAARPAYTGEVPAPGREWRNWQTPWI